MYQRMIFWNASVTSSSFFVLLFSNQSPWTNVTTFLFHSKAFVLPATTVRSDIELCSEEKKKTTTLILCSTCVLTRTLKSVRVCVRWYMISWQNIYNMCKFFLSRYFSNYTTVLPCCVRLLLLLSLFYFILDSLSHQKKRNDMVFWKVLIIQSRLSHS